MARILFTYILFILTSQACQVPVFRFALERWQADKYRLQIVHDQPLSKQTLDKLDLIRSWNAPTNSELNIRTEVYDKTTLTEAQQWSIIGLDQIKNYPSHILMAPDALEIHKPIVLTDTTIESLNAIYESPVRKKIIENLLSGDSAVFIHLLSGDKAKDTATRKLLDAALEKAKAQIKLPEGVIKPGEEAAAQAKGEIDFDNVLRSTIPLKIAFSVVSIDPKDPAEQVFLKILLNGSTPDELPENSLAAPVFGRGRCLGLFSASKLTEELILDRCNYLCGACSCSVKSENPGFDIVLHTNWDERLGEGSVIPNKTIGDLTGTGDFLSEPAIPVENKKIDSEQLNTEADQSASQFLNKVLIGIASFMALLFLAGYFFYKSRSKTSAY